MDDDRTASSQAVTESLQDLAQLLKEFNWTGVRLLISAGKVDKRKTFYKTVDKCGATKIFTAWSLDTRGWEAEAESLARQTLRTQQVTLSDQALSELIECVGPNRPQLLQELEKLTLYAGDRREITSEDIEAVVTRTKQARAFALADALGERNLPRLLRTLEEDLWEVKLDRQRSEIGLLYGLISKVRMMILAKEMVREKLVQPGLDSHRLKAQLQRVAPEHFPEDSRFNPLAMNPYPLAKAMQHAENYTTDELVQAMQLLLEGNLRLIFSSLDGSVVLQQTLVQIVGQPAARPAAGRR